MNRSTVLMGVCLPALSFAGVAAGDPAGRADIPDSASSSVDPCIVTCPAGDSVFVVVARQVDGRLWPYGTTTIDLCDCPGVVLAGVPPNGPYQVSGCRVSEMTWPDGVSSFPLEAGGLCSGASISVHCDGIGFATLTRVASFDQDGDLGVTDFDLSQVSGKQGTGDLTADFDCNGVVDAGDVAIAAGHVGHAHPSIVGVGDGPDVEFGVRPAPNPTRGPLIFVLRAPAGGHAFLAAYDLTGRRLATVLDREIEPGVHHVSWAGRDAFGRPLPTGVYLYRARLGGRVKGGLVVVAR